MGFGPDQLRDKALLALEEAVQECRYRAPRRSLALRFALAYLWAYRPADREPFDRFWKALAAERMHRFGSADRELAQIYDALGVLRDHGVVMDMWRRRFEEERG